MGLGDSIALNGACMTVTSFDARQRAASRSTSRPNRWPGPPASTARARSTSRRPCAYDRLGGHIVSGHVDGIGSVSRFGQVGESWELCILAPASLARYLAYKGSITVNGVSLTVNRVADLADGCEVSINLIPHTVQNTALGSLQAGSPVNLEIDLIARYVERMLSGSAAEKAPNETRPDPVAISPVEEIVADMKAGRIVILVDEEDRENEGDLVLAADHVTPEAINFMAKYGRGLICLTLTRERCEYLKLPPMAARNGTVYSTAFTVSIEAAEGVTTGISAADRARTIQVAVDEASKADRSGAAGPYLPAAGGRRRRADARRPHRGRLRPRGDGRLLAGVRDLRDHERRRHHGAPARPAAVRG